MAEQRRPYHGRELSSEVTWIDRVRGGQTAPQANQPLSWPKSWLVVGKWGKIMGLP